MMLDGAKGVQANIYKVPEDFSLRTEEGEEPQDVAPVQKLAGHSRYGSRQLGDHTYLICTGKLVTSSSIRQPRTSLRPHRVITPSKFGISKQAPHVLP